MRRASLLLPLFLALFTSVTFAQLSFQWTTYPVNSQGLATANGDFNGDGWPDIAVGVGDGTIAIYLNDHTGHFTFSNSFNEVRTSHLVTADLNRDGHLDLVAIDSSLQNNRGIQIWYGNGDGTFRQGPNIATHLSPTSIALGDFDEDGASDIAEVECAAGGGCTLNTWRNNGDGTFNLSGSLNSTDDPQGNVEVRDFNRDGHADVAVGGSNPMRLLAYFGDGHGGFSSPFSLGINDPIPSNAGPSGPSIAVGDFDEDGTPDIAFAAGYACGSACGQMTIHILHSNGTANSFTEISNFVGINDAPAFMAVGDLNGDLHQDMVVWNGNHFGGGAWPFLGDGQGHFTATSPDLGTDLSDVAIRDFNLDSGHDVLTSTWLGNSFAVGLNSGSTFNCSAAGGTPGAINARVCNPVNGQAVPANSPLTIEAAGNSPAGVVRLELWVDGAKVYETWNDQLKHNVTLAAGSHTLTIVAVDRYQGVGKSEVTVTAGSSGGGCAATTDKTVQICSPAAGSTVASPVQFTAAALDNEHPVTAMALYVNGTKKATSSNATLSASVPLANGTYNVTVRAWDSSGFFFSSSETFTVGTNAEQPTVSLGANPTSITAGQSSTLSWTVSNATTLTITGTDGESYQPPPTNGSLVVKPSATTTYTATAKNSTGSIAGSSVTVTVNSGGTGGGPCTATADRTVNICAPATGATVASPVQFSAAALDNEHPVTAMTLYVDSVKSAQSSTNRLTASIALANGTHKVTVRAWDSSGFFFSSSESFMVGSSSAAPTVSITANPMTVVAGGNSTLTVTAQNAGTVFVSGTDGSSYNDLSSTGGTIGIAPNATTTYTAKATNSAGQTATASVTVTVTSGGGGGCPTPATARTVTICAPKDGSSVTSPVHVDASFNSPSLTTVQIYVDGTKVQSASSDAIGHHDDGGFEWQTDVEMTTGTHRLSVKGWDSSGSFLSAVNITVSSSSSTYVYVATNNYTGTPDTISGWQVGSNGALAPVPGSPYTTPGVTSIASDQVSNAFLWALDNGTDTTTNVATFSVASNGALTQSSTTVDQPMEGPLTVSPSGHTLYGLQPGDTFSCSWRWFSIATNGSTAFQGCESFIGERELAFTPTQTFAYAPWGFHLDGGINGYTVDSAGNLTFSQTATLHAPFNNTTGRASVPSWVAMSPDGKYLVATWDNWQNSTGFALVVYSIDSTTGALTQVGSPVDEPAMGNRLIFDRSGKWLVETTQTNGTMEWSFDPATGAIGALHTTLGSGESDGIVFNKANTLMFLTTKAFDKLLVYSFDAATGNFAPAGSAITSSPVDVQLIER